jgi:hypothetical protein
MGDMVRNISAMWAASRSPLKTDVHGNALVALCSNDSIKCLGGKERKDERGREEIDRERERERQTVCPMIPYPRSL